METTVKKGLSGAVLKWIAILTMFIDHAAAMVFTTWRIPVPNASWYTVLATRYPTLYWVLRAVGRPAFPIFCFLLVEGFLHTRDVKKYLLRLLVFGLISELPFDYALFDRFTWFYQNVYFTLFLGLLAIWGMAKLAPTREQAWTENLARTLGCAAVAAAAMAAAEYLHTDYGWCGVATILLLWRFREFEGFRDLSAGASLLGAGKIEAVGWLSFALFHFYNGERGRQPKYFFYAFYPAHLALLWLIRFLATGR